MTENNFPIKPALYLFDNDQTYDLLKFENVDDSIAELISELGFEINGINLIDCFTPDGYAWADQWSTKFINAFWKLSRTHLLNNAEINGQAYGFEPKFKATIADTLGFSELPDSINLIVPKGKTVTITWLYKDLTPDEEGTGYPESLPPCNTWSKAARIYQAISENLTIKLEPKEWLFNSCVITGEGELQTTNEVKRVLLYQYLDDTLALIDSKIQLTDCEVLTGITVKVDTAIQNWQQMRIHLDSSAYAELPIQTHSITYFAPTFQRVPDNTFFCSLLKANNNAWKNGVVGHDIGKKIGISYSGGKNINFFFEESNLISPKYNVPFVDLETTYQVVGEQFKEITRIDTAFNNSDKASLYHSASNKLADDPSVDGQYFRFTNRYRLSVPIEGGSVAYSTDGRYLLVPFLGESSIFASGQATVFKTTCDIKMQYTVFNSIPEQYLGDRTVTRTEIINKTAHIINFNYADIEKTVITDYNLRREYTENYSVTTHDWGLPNDPSFNYWVTDLVSQTIPLRRDLRVGETINIPDAIEGNDKIQTISKERLDFYLGEPMADSVKVKEIHAALNAGQYGNNPLSPGQRTWNLGAMIHTIAVSQGLNFDANGKIMAVDNPVFYNDGDDVYNRYGDGQAGIAWNDKDAKGQSYGEPTPFVGYAYDVMTPQLGVNKFSGEASDLLTGGLVGCPNIPQFIDSFKRDVMKTLGGDESVCVVPSADGKTYSLYAGIADMLNELLYMGSYHSLMDMKNLVNTQKAVGMGQEILKGMGLSIDPKTFEMIIEGTTVEAIYPGIATSSPTIADLILLGLLQFSYLIPHTMSHPTPSSDKTTEVAT
jgi:hypothetical protein